MGAVDLAGSDLEAQDARLLGELDRLQVALAQDVVGGTRAGRTQLSRDGGSVNG